MATRSYGRIPSPVDLRDKPAALLLSAAAPPPPANESLLQYVSIHDQSITSACVWFAIAQAVRVFLKNNGVAGDPWMSTLFGYWNTLKLQGLGLSDNGCIPRIALDALLSGGFCEEAAWTFDPANVTTQPPPGAYVAAYDQRLLTNYYRLTSFGDQLVFDIKTAINAGHCVIWGSPVDRGYEDYNGSYIMGPPSGPFLGQHQRCLVAYNESCLIEAGSWGTLWGQNGLGLISPEFIKWDQAGDFWVFDGAPPIA
jgi:hypothetical protein